MYQSLIRNMYEVAKDRDDKESFTVNENIEYILDNYMYDSENYNNIPLENDQVLRPSYRYNGHFVKFVAFELFPDKCNKEVFIVYSYNSWYRGKIINSYEEYCDFLKWLLKDEAEHWKQEVTKDIKNHPKNEFKHWDYCSCKKCSMQTSYIKSSFKGWKYWPDIVHIQIIDDVFFASTRQIAWTIYVDNQKTVLVDRWSLKPFTFNNMDLI